MSSIRKNEPEVTIRREGKKWQARASFFVEDGSASSGPSLEHAGKIPQRNVIIPVRKNARAAKIAPKPDTVRSAKKKPLDPKAKGQMHTSICSFAIYKFNYKNK